MNPFDPFTDEDEMLEEATGLGGRRRGKRPSLQVLHIDEAVVAIDKPAGVSIESDRQGLAVIEDHEGDSAVGLPDLPEACRLVYPVEEDETGIVLLACTPQSYEALSAEGAAAVERTYLAICRGVSVDREGTIDAPLRVSDGSGGGAKTRVDPRGQAAVTQWRLRDAFIGFAAIECMPRTAVPHQVRAHLEHTGMPLAVDPEYGGAEYLMLSSFKAGYRRSRRHEERPLIERLSLHALSVRFRHPATGEAVSFESAPHKDIRATLNQLGRFGRVPGP
jgi:23S rRNA-/tRNA-specific pseudouridylate synthase